MKRIDQLWQFRYFQTREQAIAAGHVLRPYDPARPIKKWFDPVKARVYPFVLAVEDNMVGAPKKGSLGRPYLEQLVLDKADAAGMNIPPSNEPFSRLDAAEIPVPCRPLTETEYLNFVGIAAEVWVIDIIADLLPVPPSDRELLEKILQGIEKLLALKQ